MTSAGETLRRERLKRNLDLDQISQELKISRRLLDAIEADQYGRLPGGVFAKSFVRQYGALLGLDGEELATQVQRAIEPQVPQFAAEKRPAEVPVVAKVEPWKAGGESRFQLSGSLPAAILVVIVMLICSAVYAWMQRPRTTTTAQVNHPGPVIHQEPAPAVVTPAAVTPPSPEQQPAPTGAVPSSTAPSSTVPSSPAPSSTQPSSTAPSTEAAPKPATQRVNAPAGPVHVEIFAEETVWMLARVDGKFAFTGTMEAKTTRALDAEKEVYLRLGNAGGVTVSLNGKSIGPAGPKGQPRTLQFTSGGFQIVPVKPAAAVPFDPLDRL
jgi:cytoskeleton protein RodZ